ncbi:MAG: 4-aminobutyrate aminotransferase-like enzyme/Ser/Thr protein kinase RdoA (MazF antagonist) [Saprospiraceae bacterium]|jgi:4-aminobutyrate aminotransferase-like enzyme/Ser/Thr protein kinase RdoA (MazF antagonist)
MQTIFIADTLLKFYSLKGTLTPLPGYDDLNFKLKTADGHQYTVKLMHTGCDQQFIDFECAMLIHLETRLDKISTPKVIRSKAGNHFEMVEVDGQQRIFWILSWCQGAIMGQFKPLTYKLIHSLGKTIAQLTNALEGFSHPFMKNGHDWELTNALQSRHLTQYVEGETQAIVEAVFNVFEKRIQHKLSTLPHSVIHNDANENNILINFDKKGIAIIDGIFDFGDIGYQPTICEVAVALAYNAMLFEYPLRACFHFLKGYTSIRKILDQELEVLLDLLKTRLAVSISHSSYKQLEDNDPYITISQAPAKATLLKLEKIPDPLALYFFRVACGLSVTAQSTAVMQFLNDPGRKAFPVMEVDRFDCILDLSVGSLLLGANPEGFTLASLTQKIGQFKKEHSAKFAFGRYTESRRLYAAANFGNSGHPTLERRSNHLGIDLFCKAGTPVFAPFDGTVEINTVIDLPLDYGGLLVLKHQTDQGAPFYTLYGHLNPDSLTLPTGQAVKAGDQIALIGEDHENGGWPPHLHLQIIIDLAGLGKDFPGVAYESESAVWKALCPNPMLLFDVPDIELFDATVDTDQLLEERKKRLGHNLSLTYEKPLHIVSGFQQFLYDSQARTYLDFYNNVPHVGHQHPKVVTAIQEQAALLNTNTRYLHENILQYAERLTDKLPDHLAVCYFVNSATEANELAIRMARAFTNRHDMLVVESAYHGHTSTLIDISPYKHDGPGGKGAPDWVHTVPIADDYRGQWKRDNPQAGHLYANEVKEKLANIKASGHSVAALIAETYPSVGGQIIPPAGYLKEVYQHVRNHGALCIADEVQTGFGRLGQSFWAFETQGVSPDMVVLGKPIGNGFPLGAVITTKEIAEAFDNGMEYFSTFGGNPVACAAGLAVLDVIEEEKLQANATKLGQLILEQFTILKNKYPLIGDVRGEGLYLGMELVRDRKTLEPASQEATYVLNRLKDFHILAGTEGPFHNVLKFRPNMVTEERDVLFFIGVLDGIFGERYLQG